MTLSSAEILAGNHKRDCQHLRHHRQKDRRASRAPQAEASALLDIGSPELLVRPTAYG